MNNKYIIFAVDNFVITENVCKPSGSVELDQTYFDPSSCNRSDSVPNGLSTPHKPSDGLTDAMRRREVTAPWFQRRRETKWSLVWSLACDLWDSAARSRAGARGVCLVLFRAPGGGVSGLLVFALSSWVLRHLPQFVWWNNPQPDITSRPLISWLSPSIWTNHPLGVSF